MLLLKAGQDFSDIKWQRKVNAPAEEWKICSLFPLNQVQTAHSRNCSSGKMISFRKDRENRMKFINKVKKLLNAIIILSLKDPQVTTH